MDNSEQENMGFFLLCRLIEQRVVQIVQRKTFVIEWDLIFRQHV